MTVGSLLSGLFGGPAAGVAMDPEGPPIGDSIPTDGIIQGLGHIAMTPDHPLHKGLFGQTGLLRDLMGTVADSYLLQQGLPEIYAPQREQEKYADAIANFGTDPQGAIQNAMGVNAKAGNALLKTYSQSQLDAANAEQHRQAVVQQQMGNVASMLYAGRGDPRTFAAAREQAVKYALAHNMDTSLIPTEYDQAAIERFANQSVPVDKQVDNAEALRSHQANEAIQTERNNVYRQTAKSNAALGAGRLQVQAALGGAGATTAAANTGVSAANVGAKVGIAGMPARPRSGNKPTPATPTGAAQRIVIPGVGVAPRASRGTNDIGHIGGKTVYGDGKGGWTTTRK